PCSRRLNSDSRVPANGRWVCVSTNPGTAVAPPASKSSSISSSGGLSLSGPTYANRPFCTTMTPSSSTEMSRIARPRRAARPVAVAIWDRLRMRRVMIGYAVTRLRGSLEPRNRVTAQPRNQNSRIPLFEQGGQRHLIRLFLRVQHDHLLDHVQGGLEFVAGGAALELEVADGALEIADALHGLADEAVGEELGVLHDQLRFLARVGDQVFGHLLRGEQRVLQDALAVRVVLEVVAEHRDLAQQAVVFPHQPLDLFGDEVQVGAHFVGVVAFDRPRERLLLNLERSQVLHGSPSRHITVREKV